MAQSHTFRGVCSTIVREGEGTSFIYRGTTVVRTEDGPDGVVVTLHSGGWRTYTTKLRMNQAANQCGLSFSVYQKAHAWYVTTRAGTFDYFDGMQFNCLTGELNNAMPC